jgi:phosphohistidine swiveling domain-containing protein
MMKFLTRNYSYLSVSLMSEMWQKIEECQIITGIEDAVIDIDYARHIWRLDEIWIDTVSKKHLSSPLEVFWDFIIRGQKVGNELSILSRELFETIELDQTAIREKKMKDFLAWVKRFQSNVAFILVTHPLAKSVEVKLLNILKKYGVKSENLEQALLDLSITRKSNAAEDENFDLFIIQKQMGQPDFDLEEALKKHYRKHTYVKYRDPFSGGYSINEFRDRLNTKLELPDYFLPYADIISKFNTDEKKWIELQEEFVFYRTFRTERSYESIFYLERFLANIEESLQLEENELSYYNKEEIVIILQTGIRINPKLLAERKLEFAMSLHNGILTLMEGNAAKRWIEVNNEKIVRGLHEVKGLAAYRGRITGKARIVMNVKDQNNVMEGDILIVPMTTPDFMPGLLKAAAFVTDEGGVICHAAIVARELKKPCVIGTKKATTVFRNGDMVEVDGFSGIVRLITHSA